MAKRVRELAKLFRERSRTIDEAGGERTHQCHCDLVYAILGEEDSADVEFGLDGVTVLGVDLHEPISDGVSEYSATTSEFFHVSRQSPNPDEGIRVSGENSMDIVLDAADISHGSFNGDRDEYVSLRDDDSDVSDDPLQVFVSEWSLSTCDTTVDRSEGDLGEASMAGSAGRALLKSRDARKEITKLDAVVREGIAEPKVIRASKLQVQVLDAPQGSTSHDTQSGMAQIRPRVQQTEDFYEHLKDIVSSTQPAEADAKSLVRVRPPLCPRGAGFRRRLQT